MLLFAHSIQLSHVPEFTTATGVSPFHRTRSLRSRRAPGARFAQFERAEAGQIGRPGRGHRRERRTRSLVMCLKEDVCLSCCSTKSKPQRDQKRVSSNILGLPGLSG